MIPQDILSKSYRLHYKLKRNERDNTAVNIYYNTDLQRYYIRADYNTQPTAPYEFMAYINEYGKLKLNYSFRYFLQKGGVFQ